MFAMSWREAVEEECALIAAAGQWREVRSFDAAGPSGRLADGTEVVSFASNDYLGLSQHPAVKAAAHDAIERWGTGSGAARLIVGSRPIHHDLEAELASWKDCDAALVFPTGFAANLGVLATFGSPSCRIFSDELNHASIIDGARLARADVSVYRHADMDDLEAQLRDRGDRRAIVVSDLVFSMDGDLAPIDALVDICARHDALLVLDEAHAVLGPHLRAGHLDTATILRVGTLSKTLGSLGGFVAGPQPFIDLLVNAARPFIFTTALSPADAAAALAAVQIVRRDERSTLCAQLREHIELLAPGWPSPIIPVVVGDELDAMNAAAALLQRGVLVPAIRPPTVPPGTSRLRIALSAAHRRSDVERLAALLEQLDLRAAATA